jgi:hypothetical protein
VNSCVGSFPGVLLSIVDPLGWFACPEFVQLLASEATFIAAGRSSDASATGEAAPAPVAICNVKPAHVLSALDVRHCAPSSAVCFALFP